MCEPCQHGKQTRIEFKTKEHFTTRTLELVHTDLCGPTRSKGLNGEEYFMVLIDDFTRMTWVFLLKKKSKAFGYFKIFKELVENETKHKTKFLRLDNGGEFTSKEFNHYCEEHGIKRQFSVARTPHVGASSHLLEVAQFWKMSQDLWWSCGAGEVRSSQHNAEAED